MDRAISEQAAKIASLSEEVAVLKASIMDERWQALGVTIERMNQHLELIYGRLDRLEQAVRGDGGG